VQSLQRMLRPEDIQEGILQAEVAQSQAACVRDVSRKDPDRGVDLVLSVQVGFCKLMIRNSTASGLCNVFLDGCIMYSGFRLIDTFLSGNKYP
jgi:hypothetical protein